MGVHRRDLQSDATDQIGGIVWNAIMAISASMSVWPKVSHRVEYAGLYWHFVDVVWIVIFTVVYLLR